MNNENKKNNNKKTAIIVAIIVAILMIVAIILATRNEGTIGNTVITGMPRPTITIGENMVSTTPIATSTPTPVVSLDDIVGTVAPTAEPTATPKPIATATPKPTVEPTKVPEVTTTPEPTATPTTTPVPTVEPTKIPEATTTPEPTATLTATPIPTVEPTEVPEVTTTPEPTVEPTVTPSPTSRPTPIPGDDIGVEFGSKVTLDSGVEMSVLTDYNNAGIYSNDTRVYGWYGDGQDNRDATAQKDKEMFALEDAIGVTASHGTGFLVTNYAINFYWDSVGGSPDLGLYRDVDNKCYYLAINYDLTEGGTVTPKKARDVLRMLLSICSSNPIELENWIYNDCFVTNNPCPEDIWNVIGDSKVCFPSYDENIPYAKWIYVIKQ